MSLVNLSREELLVEFDLQILPEDQKEKAWQLIFDIFQTRILDFILSQLAEEEKEIFLKTLIEDEDRSEIFVQEKVPDIEAKLEELIKEIKKELLTDFKKAKRNKSDV